MKNHEYFINKCIELAKMGNSDVSPNPMVGSIIVSDNKIIGSGYHKSYGHDHAEVNAINNVKDKSLLNKSILYVNLEPCCHFGKTPPCADLIIKNKIAKVVIGCVDPNSKVSGKGIKKLKDNSVDVIYGILNKECKELNKRFFTFNKLKRPYIILKWAKSSDNFISPHNQIEPFWMTSEKSKKTVHKWRSQEDSILVGTNTAIIDNPRLNVRLVKGKNPIRIVIDKKLNLSKDLEVFNTDVKTIILNEVKSFSSATNDYLKVDFSDLINQLLDKLYELNIMSMIVEGGAFTINKFINENAYDEIRIFTTPEKLKKGVKSPIIPIIKKIYSNDYDGDLLEIYRK